MNENKKNLIVTLADVNFLDQAKQLFSSVYFKAGWSGDYLLLASDIPEADLKWFKEKGILIYHCPLLYNKPVGDLAHSPVVLSKFYLFKEYFKQWDKIIFLDADMIVEGSLDGLLTVSGFGAAKAITLQLKDEFIARSKLSLDFKNKFKLSGPAFSTGIFIFDSALIKKSTFEEMISWYWQFKDQIRFNEESIMNLYFYKNWTILPMCYNATPWYLESRYSLPTNNRTAIVIHFNCYKIKPWQIESAYYEKWQNNFKLADKIDIAKSLEAEIIWNKNDFQKYRRLLRLKRLICFFHLDKSLGAFGLFIKKVSPRLYNAIKIK